MINKIFPNRWFASTRNLLKWMVTCSLMLGLAGTAARAQNPGTPPPPVNPNLKPVAPGAAPINPNLGPAGPQLPPVGPNLGNGPNLSPIAPNPGPNLNPVAPSPGASGPFIGPNGPNVGPVGPNLSPINPNVGPSTPNVAPGNTQVTPTQPGTGTMVPNTGTLPGAGVSQSGGTTVQPSTPPESEPPTPLQPGQSRVMGGNNSGARQQSYGTGSVATNGLQQLQNNPYYTPNNNFYTPGGNGFATPMTNNFYAPGTNGFGMYK